MTMKNRTLIVVFSIAAVAATGCAGFERQSSLTGPSAAGNNSMLGNWTSSSLIPTPSSCTNFKWNVTEQTATSAKGTFTATCAGELQLTGTAQGAFTTPVTIVWTAQGNATAPGLTSCAILLTGAAEIGTDSIRVPYSGDTCLGPVSGIETLKKR
jgi:hypothetical protein